MDPVEGMLRELTVLGGALVGVGLLIVVAGRDIDDMPTQVVPRRLAVYPIAAGLALLLIAAVTAAFP